MARRPQLVLVDEFAHTNVPGSRHPKRLHDVEELLAAGIDVSTTVNIQHLESLNDAVAQITGIRVRETIPDRRHAEWMAIYVETPRHHRLSDADCDRVAQTLGLDEQLGGEAVTIPGHNLAEELIRYARSRNVTEVIIAKSRRSRWSEIWRGSVVHDLIRKSGNIDVYVISADDEPAQQTRRSVTLRAPLWHLNAYLGSALAVVLAGLIAKLIESFLPLPNLSIVFLPAVLLSAVTWGLWPAIFAAILSMLVYDFGFVPPMYTLTVPSPQDLLALGSVLIWSSAGKLQGSCMSN